MKVSERQVINALQRCNGSAYWRVSKGGIAAKIAHLLGSNGTKDVVDQINAIVDRLVAKGKLARLTIDDFDEVQLLKTERRRSPHRKTKTGRKRSRTQRDFHPKPARTPSQASRKQPKRSARTGLSVVDLSDTPFFRGYMPRFSRIAP
jgi:hypothetical protein